MRSPSAEADAVAPGVAPVRVGFVVHVMQVAGAEVLVAETIRRLRDQIAPVVWCLDDVGRLGEQLAGEGVPVVTLGRHPGLDWRVAGRLAVEIDRRRVDVVHAHQYTPFFYSALARLRGRRRIHLMFTEHGRHYPDVVSSKRRIINRLVLSRAASEINAVCGFSARSLAEIDGFTRRPIDVIENGIDVARYGAATDRDALRLRLGLDPERRYVICVARFHPVKDHASLLRAFVRVSRAMPDVDLLLAGEGPLRGELETLAGHLEIADRVRFLGVRRDVPDLLRASDVFALTSVSEAASLTVLEAMAARLPLVVTDVGGNPEMVRQDVDGRLVPRGDPEAIAAALLGILGDPARGRSMGEAARARVIERYQLDDTIRKYHDRYVAAAQALRGRSRDGGAA